MTTGTFVHKFTSPAGESLLVFGVVLATLVAGLAPGATFGDAGEFAAAIATLGLPHAPSYPLETLLGKAFGIALGLGNWGYRASLLSSVCGALAVALLVDASRMLGAPRAARWAAGACLVATALFRREAAVAEVFGLHVLAAGAVVWLCCAFRGRLLEPRPAAALGLVFGLGFSNHHTLALFGPAVLLAVGLERPSPRAAARWVLGFAVFFALGAALYAFLPLRAHVGPPLNWGRPTTWARFLHVLLRRDYGSFSLTVDGAASAGALTQLWRFFELSSRAAPLLLGAGVAGLALSRHAWLVLAFVFAGPVFLMAGRPPFDPQTSGALDRFLLAPLAALVPAAAAAFSTSRWLAWLAAGALAVSAPRETSRWDLAAYDYGRSILRSLPRDSALFMDGGDDTFYSLAWLQQAEARRRDIELHDRGGLVFASAYGADFRGLDRAGKDARRAAVERVYAEQGRLFYSTLAESLHPAVPLAPWGLLRKAGSAGRWGSGLWELYPERWDERDLEARYRDRALIGAYPYLKAASLREAGRYAEALAELERAERLAGDAIWARANLPYTLAHLGYRAAQANRWPVAERAYAQSLRLEPRNSDTARSLAAIRGRLAGR